MIIKMYSYCNSHATELNIENLNLSLNQIDEISKIMQSLKVSSLILSNCALNFNESVSILDLLKDNKYITRLKLNKTDIRLKDAEAISNIFKSNTSSLKEVIFNDIIIDEYLSIKLLNGLETNKSIVTINLINFLIIPRIAECISTILKLNSSIKFLELIKSNISSECANQIANGLEINNGLVEITLYESNIKIQDLTKILNAIVSNNNSNVVKVKFFFNLWKSATIDEKIAFSTVLLKVRKNGRKLNFTFLNSEEEQTIMKEINELCNKMNK